MAPPVLRRRFADLAHGQMHYRMGGAADGVPLLMIHASPGSSKQLARLAGELATVARVIAPDTPGNGDSDPLPPDAPTIADLATAYRDLLDALGLDRVRVYGAHTGAAIAAELAILAPERVERLVLDGVQRLGEADRAALLARYADPFVPDLDGGYLARAFQFCRDQHLFYPWYERTAAARRRGGLPAARDLHDFVVELLKAAETYHLNYRAAFRWRSERLALVSAPLLVIAAESDPLFADSRLLAEARGGAFVALPRSDAPDFAARRRAAIVEFLG